MAPLLLLLLLLTSLAAAAAGPEDTRALVAFETILNGVKKVPKDEGMVMTSVYDDDDPKDDMDESEDEVDEDVATDAAIGRRQEDAHPTFRPPMSMSGVFYNPLEAHLRSPSAVFRRPPPFPFEPAVYMRPPTREAGYATPERLVPPNAPACATAADVCFEDPEYPRREVLLAVQSRGCGAEVRRGAPLRARTTRGLWKVVAQGAGLQQTIDTQTCTGSRSGGCRCVQQWAARRLVAWAADEGLHEDEFRVPVACACSFPPEDSSLQRPAVLLRGPTNDHKTMNFV